MFVSVCYILPVARLCYMQAWVKARQASDWSQFAPVLQEWVDLRREEAKLINPDAPVYDVLLDEFEKGMTVARLDEVFVQVGLCRTIWPVDVKTGCVE